jgi:hypothetical protein
LESVNKPPTGGLDETDAGTSGTADRFVDGGFGRGFAWCPERCECTASRVTRSVSFGIRSLMTRVSRDGARRPCI